MHILVVSATQFEVAPLLDYLGIRTPVIGMNSAPAKPSGYSVSVLITGVGMVNTALMMGRYAGPYFDLVVNAGVCGAFNRKLQTGDVVLVNEDVLSELGAEDGYAFLTYDQLGLPGQHVFRPSPVHTWQALAKLPRVKGITVNTVHGHEASIARIEQLYHPDVESMEGAAFFAACGDAVAGIQVRAVSNYVERRDKSKWQMPLAIANLNDRLIALIREIGAL